MDKYFINQQKEITEQLLKKSNEELLEFLDMENNNA